MASGSRFRNSNEGFGVLVANLRQRQVLQTHGLAWAY
jgi:hypothetical protein